MSSVRLGATLCLVVGLSIGASGCAAWQNHNETTKVSRNAFQEGRFDEALKSLEAGVNNELDGLCYQLDRGVIAQVGGKYDVSIGEFEHAEATIEKFEDRGLTGSGVAEQVGAFAVNEKTIPYEGESFEKILVPVFNSRNYLLQHQIDEAMIEVRKIWFQQKVCKQLNDKEIEQTNAKAKEQKVDSSACGDIDSKVQYPGEALKSPESIYEITFAHYIASLISERMGEINDAYISLKDVAKVRGDLPFIQRDLLRLARANGFEDDVDDLKKRYQVTAPGKDEGSVALLFDCGWAPHKEELKFAVPGYKTFAAVAVPIYKRTPDPAHHARLVLNDKVFDTHVMSDLEAIVFKYHRNKLPTIIVRQIIRTTLKAVAGSAAAAGTDKAVGGRAGGLAGWGVGLAAGVYNYESEQADLRAWLTLPRNFQAIRAWVPAGDYDARIELVGEGGGVLGSVALGKLTVKAGSLRFACARSLGSSLFGKLLAEREDRAPKKTAVREAVDMRKADAPAGPATPPVDKAASSSQTHPDAPKADAPVGDAPKADAPAGDAPRADAPKADAPKADVAGDSLKGGGDAPKADAPPADAPKADAPK